IVDLGQNRSSRPPYGRLRPGDANTLASRGFAHLKLKRYEAVIADYDAGLLINPGNPYTLFGRGMAKRMTGNPSGGDADMVAAKATKPDIAVEMAKLGTPPLAQACGPLEFALPRRVIWHVPRLTA